MPRRFIIPSAFPVVLALFVIAFASHALPPLQPIDRLLPPKGVALDPADAAALRAEVSELRRQMSSMAKDPLLPDAEIYVEAVALALDNEEWEKKGDAALARQHLATAKSRLAELKAGKPQWIAQRGMLVRGFRSRIDGAAQPFGVEIRDDEDGLGTAPKACYVWLHGRGDKETNLYFMRNRETKKGQFAPPRGTIVIHPFGRHCLGFKSAGETDVIESLQAAARMYAIDLRRVALMGFSMGGAGAWHLGAHFPDKWAVVHAGAGFVDVRRYKGVDSASVPEWERQLWGVYDVPDYARNFLNLPLAAYSGEVDKQKAAADIMAAELQTHGHTLQHFIGPGMGHKYHPDTQKQVQAVIDEALRKGRDSGLGQLHFQTKTLRYNRCHWLEIMELEKHWQDSRVDAAYDGKTLRITEKNLASFRFAASVPFQNIEINGKPVGQGIGQFVKLGGNWQGIPPDYHNSPGFWKTPGLQGPMDDALLDSFLVVLPEAPCRSEWCERWTKFEAAHFEKFWREVFRGRLRQKPASRVTREDMQSCHLILWGDPAANALIAKISSALPIQWNGEFIVAGKNRHPADTHMPALIYPNPLNPKRYIVLNNGCSFREGHCSTNALQNPKLPDWVIYDLTTPPDALAAGKIAAAGFFNESWRLPP